MSVACPLPLAPSCLSSSSSASSSSSLSLLQTQPVSLKRLHCSLLQPPPPKRLCSSRRISVAQLIDDAGHNKDTNELPSLLAHPTLTTETICAAFTSSPPPASSSSDPPFQTYASSSISSPSINSQSQSHPCSPTVFACTEHPTASQAGITSTGTSAAARVGVKGVERHAGGQDEQEGYHGGEENPERERRNDSCSLPDKFTKSRAVGQSHRDNERGHIHALSEAVAKGRQENLLLLSLYLVHPRNVRSACDLENVVDVSYNSNTCGQVQGDLKANECDGGEVAEGGEDDEYDVRGIRSCLDGDVAEDEGVHASDIATAHGLYELSPESARRLGQRFISAEVAAALLEFIACRRNLVAPQHDPKDPARPRRRRTSYRSATSQQQAETIVMYCINVLCRKYNMTGESLLLRRRHGLCYENEETLVMNDKTKSEGFERLDAERIKFIDDKLGALGRLLRYFDEMESMYNPPKWSDIQNGSVMDGDGEGDGNGTRMRESPPESPTRPDAAEFGSPSRRRGEGAKRCSRCHKLKVSGSGHGRSKCDDGHSISSSVPYPASTQPEADHYQSSN